jgi:enoyl-CoA hydratase
MSRAYATTVAAVPIHYAADEHVVTITIDRPARRNALDMEHFDALAAAWKRFRDDGDAWVAIVTGVEGAFCAGGDLRDYLPLLTAAGPDEREQFRSGTEAVLRDLDIFKPIIAAVNGPCVAGGMELLNGTDIRLACPEAVFGMLEPKRGLFASGGTSALLPRQITWPAAMELLLTAEPVPATRALELGLLNEIVPRARLLERAQEWAARITENAPLAVAATKESARRGLAAPSLAEALDIEARISARVLRTDDAREGPRAFVEKRAPRWTAT